ncbi:MAG: dienelactone hydrolase family protein [Alphaproteobacteria bacterium]
MVLRLFKWAVLLGTAGMLFLATYVWGESKGWWAKTLPIEERNAMLAPFDEVFVPDPARFGPPPYPGVLLLHNCYGGLVQVRDWAEFLRANGIMAHVSDSLAGRGLGHEIPRMMGCYGALFYPVERAGDVMANLMRFRAHPALDSTRIGVLALSHGGTTLFEALAVADSTTPPRGYAKTFAPSAFAGVRAHIVMYPNCGALNQVRVFPVPAPLLWLHGGADKVTPLRECDDIFADAKAKGYPIKLEEFPGANHNFDMLEGGLRNLNVEQGKADRRRARAAVLAFLRDHLMDE